VVDLRCGDETEIIAGLPGPFDYVFFDADRYSALVQLSSLMPKLTSNVLLLADNVLSHPCAGYAGHPFLNEGVPFMKKGNMVWKSALSTASLRTDDPQSQHSGAQVCCCLGRSMRVY
jgi:hypothetical protein